MNQVARNLTDHEGKYRIPDIAAGNYLLFFEKSAFIASPQGAAITLKEDDTQQQNATLYQENPDAAYFASLAGKFKAKAHASSSVITAYESEWRILEQSEVSPEFKTGLANALKKQDKEVENIPWIRENLEDFKEPQIDLRPNATQPVGEVEKAQSTNGNHTDFKKPETQLQINDLLMTNQDKSTPPRLAHRQTPRKSVPTAEPRNKFQNHSGQFNSERNAASPMKKKMSNQRQFYEQSNVFTSRERQRARGCLH